MKIISARGENKMVSADVYVVSATAGLLKRSLCARWTSSVAITRAAAESNVVTWNTVNFDNANFLQPAVSYSRVYIPMDGYYLLNAWIGTQTALAGKMGLQIHSHNLGGFMSYKTLDVAAAAAAYPNFITTTAKKYLLTGDYCYVYWASSFAVTSLTGISKVGFGVWKVDG